MGHSQLKLNAGGLNAEEFLNKLAFRNNIAVTGMEDVTISEFDAKDDMRFRRSRRSNRKKYKMLVKSGG